MYIVVDSNIFFSALLKEGITRKLIIESNEKLIIPEYFFNEVKEHEKEIISKTELNFNEYTELSGLLLKHINVISNEVILPYREEAIEIVKNIDIDDALFVATALAFKDAIIWSNDKKLKKQNRIKIISTSEMIFI